MREICASGSVGGEGGNILAYPAAAVAGISDSRRSEIFFSFLDALLDTLKKVRS